MTGPETTPSATEDLAERLRLAQEAFVRLHAKCFWSWSRDTVITPELLPNVARALRHYGGRAEWTLSERICPSTRYSARYSPPSEADDTPTAT